MSDELDDLLDLAAKRNGRGWPRMPRYDADLVTIRNYLTEAACLPPGYVVDLVERFGPYGSDPMTITVRTPGEAKNIQIRFRNQRDASKPSALRAAFAEATAGASRMKYPKPAESSDYYVMLCALARVTEDMTAADDTRSWLDQYLTNADLVLGRTLRPEGRYDALQTLRARNEFARPQAMAWNRRELEPGSRWALLIDSETEEQWIRAGEFATYVRHVIGGVGHLGQHTLDALMVEIDADRVYMTADRRTRGFGRPALVLYRIPPHLHRLLTDPHPPT